MNVVVRFIDSSNSPITGETPTLTICRLVDGYFYDFDDSAFKTSGWVDVDGDMSEIDATRFPGGYNATPDESGWNDGEYLFSASVTSGATTYYGTGTQKIIDGEPIDEAIITDIAVVDANVDILVGGAGLYAITFQIYQTGTTTEIAGVKISVYSGGDLVATGTTDSNGQVEIALNADTFDVYLSKFGVNFSTEEITVSADATETIYGTPIAAVPAPSESGVCKVYMFLRDISGQNAIDEITAFARINTLPYLADTKLHVGYNYAPTLVDSDSDDYDPDVGEYFYWNCVHGADVYFEVKEASIADNATITAVSTIALQTLLGIT